MVRRKYLSVIIFMVVFSALFSGVSHAQEEIWNRNQRPASPVKCDEHGVYIISNVRWGFDDPSAFTSPRFRTVRFKADDVKDVYFATQPFPPDWLLTHSLMIFEFKTPVITDKNERSSALVLSIEPRLKSGQYCDLIFRGNCGAFPIIYQIGSFEDYVQYGLNGIGRGGLGGKNVFVDKLMKFHRLYNYKLKLDGSKKIELLKLAIKESVFDRSGEKYDTLHNSCTNNLFALINKILPDGSRYDDKKIRKILYSHAIVKRLLKSKDLFAEATPAFTSGSPAELSSPSGIFQPIVPEAASKSKAEFSLAVADLKSAIRTALLEGDVNGKILASVMYDDFSKQVGALYIPGVFPESSSPASSGEFIVGEEFILSINRLGTNENVADYIAGIFDEYEKRLGERIAMGGADVSKSARMRLESLKRSITQVVKYSKFYKNDQTFTRR